LKQAIGKSVIWQVGINKGRPELATFRGTDDIRIWPRGAQNLGHLMHRFGHGRVLRLGMLGDVAEGKTYFVRPPDRRLVVLIELYQGLPGRREAERSLDMKVITNHRPDNVTADIPDFALQRLTGKLPALKIDSTPKTVRSFSNSSEWCLFSALAAVGRD